MYSFADKRKTPERHAAAPIAMQRKAIQRCKGVEHTTVSTFMPDKRLDRDDGQGDGGVVSVVRDNGRPFPHYSVVLEWFDGIRHLGTELAAHMVVPELAGNPGAQFGSVFRFGQRTLKGKIQSRSWGSVMNQHATQTRELSEEVKEHKRRQISQEIHTEIPMEGDYQLPENYADRTPKEYNYGLLGIIDNNCKTWANRICRS
ncbi:MAG: hypothetical protein CENE_02908 [Candidatus Celerinatantimonas neptuna]|nr:MAG: hypothetical protein CENE_02908 [Candidatus Celerinatantimonas neptuna]